MTEPDHPLTLGDLHQSHVTREDILRAVASGAVPPTYTVERALRARGDSAFTARRRIKSALRRGDPLGMTDGEKIGVALISAFLVIAGLTPAPIKPVKI